jgi:hypothetical protein
MRTCGHHAHLLLLYDKLKQELIPQINRRLICDIIYDRPLLPFTTPFTAQASDPDNNALTFSLDPGAPAGASINSTTGAFSWTPPLTGFSLITNLTVRVTDNGIPNLSAAETISIAVIAGPVMLTAKRSGTTATVFWRTAPGKHYQLQYKNTLPDAAWTDIGPVLAATDFTTSEPDNTIGTNGQRYYRVHLLDP